jgi:hypothetical protein
MMAYGLLISAAPAMADSLENLDARPGQWSTVIAIFDHNNNHYLLKTTVNDDPEMCWAKLEDMASKVKQENGVVWTNHAKSVINYEKKSGYAELSAKVLELRCVLEPFTPEYVKKL